MDRRHSKNIAFSLALILLCLLVFTGCNNGEQITSQTEQTVISFSWWGNDDRNEYTLAAINRFEELHPDIKVECNYSEWSGYQTRYDIQMISNTESDVMQINYAWLTTYSPDGGRYYDLNKLDGSVSLNSFDEEALNYGMVNGSLNAVPIALNTMTVYINKSIYDDYGLDVPAAWDDFFRAAEVMNGETYPIAMSAKSAWFFIVSYAEQQTGKPFMNQDGSINFTAADVQIMLDFYTKLVNENVIPQVEYFEKGDIASGEYAGFFAWLSDADSYSAGAIENGYEYVIADYTGFDTLGSSGYNGWYAKPATMYAISSNTEHPEEAALLLDFLLNSTDMAEYQGIEKGIPLSTLARTYLEETEQLNGIQYNAYLKMQDNINAINIISPYFEDTDVLEAFKLACNDVLFDKADSYERSVQLLQEFRDILSD